MRGIKTLTEYIVYCDESIKHGKYYSNFYGGAIIKSTFLQETIDELYEKKLSLKISGEIKWEKVHEYYLEQYKEMLNLFLVLSKVALSRFELCLPIIIFNLQI